MPLELHFFLRLIMGMEADSQQHKVDNQPPFRDPPYSDAYISKKFCVSHRQAVVHSWECWSMFLVARCPSWRQPTRIREEKFI